MTIPAALNRHAPARRLDDLPIAALLVSVEHERVSGANELAEELFGFALGDIVGVPLSEVLPGLGELALRREEVTMARVEALRGGGTPFPAEVRLRALPSRPAEVLCVVSGLSDADVVTRAATHFEAAFDHAPIGMALFNCDGEYIRVNSTLCAMLGRGEDELLGRRDQELTHPDDSAQDVEVAWRGRWPGSASSRTSRSCAGRATSSSGSPTSTR